MGNEATKKRGRDDVNDDGNAKKALKVSPLAATTTTINRNQQINRWIELNCAQNDFLAFYARVLVLRQTLCWAKIPANASEDEKKEALNKNQIIVLENFWKPVADYALSKQVLCIPNIVNANASTYEDVFLLLLVGPDAATVLSNFNYFRNNIFSRFVQNDAYHNAYLRLRNEYVNGWETKAWIGLFHKNNRCYFPNIWNPYLGICFWHTYLTLPDKIRRSAAIYKKNTSTDIPCTYPILYDPHINEISTGNTTIWHLIRDDIDVAFLLSRHDLDMSVHVEGKSVPEYMNLTLASTYVKLRVEQKYHLQFLLFKEIIAVVFNGCLLPDLQAIILFCLYCPLVSSF